MMVSYGKKAQSGRSLRMQDWKDDSRWDWTRVTAASQGIPRSPRATWFRVAKRAEMEGTCTHIQCTFIDLKYDEQLESFGRHKCAYAQIKLKMEGYVVYYVKKINRNCL